MSRLRVLLVTGEYPPDEGGVADYTRWLAEALLVEGLAVDVLTDRRHHAISAAYDRPWRAGCPSAPNVHRVMPSWSWTALERIERVAGVTGPDLVHIQYQAAAYQMGPAIHLAPWWLGRRGFRTVVTYHDLKVPYLFPKAGRVRRWAVDALSRRADLTIVTNAEDHAAVAAHGRARSLALVPIGSNIPDSVPPGYDPSAWRIRFGVDPAAPLVAYFGMLNTSKGARVLAGALGSLVAAGRDARLVMIGAQVGASDPTNRGYLEAFRNDIAARGLAERVVWTGHMPPEGVSAWLHAADVVALPYADGASYRRGSLMAALEHGAAIVTTTPSPAPDAPGAPPPLVDGRSARLVPPGDPDALARALSEILDDVTLRAHLSDGARDLARSFAWDAIARRHAGLYQALVGGE
jgi:glycosyltransferase involved in cell wall biosynthesis